MFIVTEIKSQIDSAEISSTFHLDRNDADKKYFTILANAATSDIPIHTATMITQEGYFCKSDTFDHRPEPGPDL